MYGLVVIDVVSLSSIFSGQIPAADKTAPVVWIGLSTACIENSEASLLLFKVSIHPKAPVSVHTCVGMRRRTG